VNVVDGDWVQTNAFAPAWHCPGGNAAPKGEKDEVLVFDVFGLRVDLRVGMDMVGPEDFLQGGMRYG
jgi:hypothetical protein